jgi:hypothetical protein
MRGVYIYPYNSGSASARALRDSLDITMIRRERSTFIGGGRKVVINWGSTEVPPQVGACELLNDPVLVRGVSNKLRFFQHMPEGVTPPYCTTPLEASRMATGGNMVVCRTTLAGHSGEGIRLASEGQQMPICSLYTLYIPKTVEYRVHVVGGQVVDRARKVRNPAVPDGDINWQVRSHDNGFIFTRNGSMPHLGECEVLALRAVREAGLEFGGVDVIWSDRYSRAYVLEINSAPGIEGQTLISYTHAFRQILRGYGKT